MSLLITGGLGYIGSHIAKISKRKKLVIIDNQSNSNLKYKKIFPKANIIVDDVNLKSLNKIFNKFNIKEVIHCAGLKSVNLSIKNPLKYYRNNVNTTLDLLESMEKFNINKLVFSSSATVYGNSYKSPLRENLDTIAINPYGETKIINEELIKNFCRANNNFCAMILRYFNPIGAHKSGKLSDNPLGSPQNLMPLIIRSIERNQYLEIFGNNYKTPDKTRVRDYIHVVDLAEAHLVSLNYLKEKSGFHLFNVGLGKGISVLDLIKIFEKTNNLKIKYKFTKRREGDAAISFASNKEITKNLNWFPKLSYENMCRDAWNAKLFKNLK